MTINKELRVVAAALTLGLFSANTFAQPAESVTDNTRFQITAEVEDSISVDGLGSVTLDLDNRDDDGFVRNQQQFTVIRRGAKANAPAHFTITADSPLGAPRPGYHAVKNQRDEILPMAIDFYNEAGSGRLANHIPLKNMKTTNAENEHYLIVGFHPEDLEDPKPGSYTTDVTITVAAE